MRRTIRWTLAAGIAAALLAACGGSSDGSGGSAVFMPATGEKIAPAASAQTTTATPGSTAPSADPSIVNAPTLIEGTVSDGRGPQDVDPFKEMSEPRHVSPVLVNLSALPQALSDVPQKSLALNGSVPLKVGIPRAVAETSDQTRTASTLAWHDTASGSKLAALRFLSPGAKGLRVGVLVKSLPLGAKLRFYADGADKLFEVPALDVLNTIARNRLAGDLSDAGGTYWSPNLGGEAITMEIEVASESDIQVVAVSIPTLSHANVDVRKLDGLMKIGESSSCNLDVPCTTAYNQLSQSVALMDFIGDGSNGTTTGAAYVCTGTLLNDRMSTGTPWFLSAKHCIPTQTVASTLYTQWFYRSSSCNSGSINPNAQLLTTGATLLFTSPVVAGQSPQGDTSFMRLNSLPPSGALYAGSSSYAVSLGTPIYGVHHPKGDVQKYSTGLVTWIEGTAPFFDVTWSAGTTEGGSSGSGLFVRMNGKDYLVGQLYGGYSSCQTPRSTDYYGRFDVAYNAGVAQWLNATTGDKKVPIYRLYNSQTRTYFYTTSELERDAAVYRSSSYSYEGIAFYAYMGSGIANDVVYRFFNTATATHFYTINPVERDQIINTPSTFNFEGAAWYASASSQPQSAAMFRFYNRLNNTHFYTINQIERDTLIRANSPAYIYEGVAYYAWLSPS